MLYREPPFYSSLSLAPSIPGKEILLVDMTSLDEF
jgi:hypothetical protein